MSKPSRGSDFMAIGNNRFIPLDRDNTACSYEGDNCSDSDSYSQADNKNHMYPDFYRTEYNRFAKYNGLESSKSQSVSASHLTEGMVHISSRTPRKSKLPKKCTQYESYTDDDERGLGVGVLKRNTARKGLQKLYCPPGATSFATTALTTSLTSTTTKDASNLNARKKSPHRQSKIATEIQYNMSDDILSSSSISASCNSVKCEATIQERSRDSSVDQRVAMSQNRSDSEFFHDNKYAEEFEEGFEVVAIADERELESSMLKGNGGSLSNRLVHHHRLLPDNTLLEVVSTTSSTVGMTITTREGDDEELGDAEENDSDENWTACESRSIISSSSSVPILSNSSESQFSPISVEAEQVSVVMSDSVQKVMIRLDQDSDGNVETLEWCQHHQGCIESSSSDFAAVNDKYNDVGEQKQKQQIKKVQDFNLPLETSIFHEKCSLEQNCNFDKVRVGTPNDPEAYVPDNDENEPSSDVCVVTSRNGPLTKSSRGQALKQHQQQESRFTSTSLVNQTQNRDEKNTNCYSTTFSSSHEDDRISDNDHDYQDELYRRSIPPMQVVTSAKRVSRTETRTRPRPGRMRSPSESATDGSQIWSSRTTGSEDSSKSNSNSSSISISISIPKRATRQQINSTQARPLTIYSDMYSTSLSINSITSHSQSTSSGSHSCTDESRLGYLDRHHSSTSNSYNASASGEGNDGGDENSRIDKCNNSSDEDNATGNGNLTPQHEALPISETIHKTISRPTDISIGKIDSIKHQQQHEYGFQKNERCQHNDSRRQKNDGTASTNNTNGNQQHENQQERPNQQDYSDGTNKATGGTGYNRDQFSPTNRKNTQMTAPPPPPSPSTPPSDNDPQDFVSSNDSNDVLGAGNIDSMMNPKIINSYHGRAFSPVYEVNRCDWGKIAQRRRRIEQELKEERELRHQQGLQIQNDPSRDPPSDFLMQQDSCESQVDTTTNNNIDFLVRSPIQLALSLEEDDEFGGCGIVSDKRDDYLQEIVFEEEERIRVFDNVNIDEIIDDEEDFIFMPFDVHAIVGFDTQEELVTSSYSFDVSEKNGDINPLQIMVNQKEQKNDGAVGKTFTANKILNLPTGTRQCIVIDPVVSLEKVDVSIQKQSETQMQAEQLDYKVTTQIKRYSTDNSTGQLSSVSHSNEPTQQNDLQIAIEDDNEKDKEENSSVVLLLEQQTTDVVVDCVQNDADDFLRNIHPWEGSFRIDSAPSDERPKNASLKCSFRKEAVALTNKFERQITRIHEQPPIAGIPIVDGFNIEKHKQHQTFINYETDRPFEDNYEEDYDDATQDSDYDESASYSTVESFTVNDDQYESTAYLKCDNDSKKVPYERIRTFEEPNIRGQRATRVSPFSSSPSLMQKQPLLYSPRERRQDSNEFPDDEIMDPNFRIKAGVENVQQPILSPSYQTDSHQSTTDKKDTIKTCDLVVLDRTRVKSVNQVERLENNYCYDSGSKRELKYANLDQAIVDYSRNGPPRVADASLTSLEDVAPGIPPVDQNNPQILASNTIRNKIAPRSQTFEDRRVALEAEGLYVAMRTTQPVDPPPSCSMCLSKTSSSVCSQGSNHSGNQRDLIIEGCNDVDCGTEIIHDGKMNKVYVSTLNEIDDDKTNNDPVISAEINNAELVPAIADDALNINNCIGKVKDDKSIISNNMSIRTKFTVSSVFHTIQESIYSILTPSSIGTTIATVDALYRGGDLKTDADSVPGIVLHPAQPNVSFDFKPSTIDNQTATIPWTMNSYEAPFDEDWNNNIVDRIVTVNEQFDSVHLKTEANEKFQSSIYHKSEAVSNEVDRRAQASKNLLEEGDSVHPVEPTAMISTSNQLELDLLERNLARLWYVTMDCVALRAVVTHKTVENGLKSISTDIKQTLVPSGPIDTNRTEIVTERDDSKLENDAKQFNTSLSEVSTSRRLTEKNQKPLKGKISPREKVQVSHVASKFEKIKSSRKQALAQLKRELRMVDNAGKYGAMPDEEFDIRNKNASMANHTRNRLLSVMNTMNDESKVKGEMDVRENSLVCEIGKANEAYKKRKAEEVLLVCRKSRSQEVLPVCREVSPICRKSKSSDEDLPVCMPSKSKETLPGCREVPPICRKIKSEDVSPPCMRSKSDADSPVCRRSNSQEVLPVSREVSPICKRSKSEEILATNRKSKYDEDFPVCRKSEVEDVVPFRSESMPEEVVPASEISIVEEIAPVCTISKSEEAIPVWGQNTACDSDPFSLTTEIKGAATDTSSAGPHHLLIRLAKWRTDSDFVSFENENAIVYDTVEKTNAIGSETECNLETSPISSQKVDIRIDKKKKRVICSTSMLPLVVSRVGKNVNGGGTVFNVPSHSEYEHVERGIIDLNKVDVAFNDDELHALMLITKNGDDVSPLFPTFSIDDETVQSLDIQKSNSSEDDGLTKEIEALTEFGRGLRQEIGTYDLLHQLHVIDRTTDLDKATFPPAAKDLDNPSNILPTMKTDSALLVEPTSSDLLAPNPIFNLGSNVPSFHTSSNTRVTDLEMQVAQLKNTSFSSTRTDLSLLSVPFVVVPETVDPQLTATQKVSSMKTIQQDTFPNGAAADTPESDLLAQRDLSPGNPFGLTTSEVVQKVINAVNIALPLSPSDRERLQHAVEQAIPDGSNPILNQTEVQSPVHITDVKKVDGTCTDTSKSPNHSMLLNTDDRYCIPLSPSGSSQKRVETPSTLYLSPRLQKPKESATFPSRFDECSSSDNEDSDDGLAELQSFERPIVSDNNLEAFPYKPTIDSSGSLVIPKAIYARALMSSSFASLAVSPVGCRSRPKFCQRKVTFSENVEEFLYVKDSLQHFNFNANDDTTMENPPSLFRTVDDVRVILWDLAAEVKNAVESASQVVDKSCVSSADLYESKEQLSNQQFPQKRLRPVKFDLSSETGKRRFID